MTKGILRNKNDVEPNQDAHGEQLDRQEVIKNTRLNAQLSSDTHNGDEIRAKIAKEKALHSKPGDPDHLKWDELNLYQTEQEKCATMKIDEPKTPYEGGFDPNNEYYKEDDIPDFELGAPEVAVDASKAGESLNGGQIIKDQTTEEVEDEPEQKPEPVSAEEKHKRFEEMRKQHYHLKGNALKKGFQVSDDEE